MARQDIEYSVDYPASDAMASMTLKVRITGLTVLKVRLWCAVQLMKLAAVIAGCGVQIEAE